MTRRLGAFALAGLLAGHAVGQEEGVPGFVTGLQQPDPASVEEARRELCDAAAEALPVQQLIRLLALDAATAKASASVLRHHGLARDQRRALLSRDEVVLQLEALSLASDAELSARLRHPDPSLRLAAFRELTDRAELNDAQLAAALDDDDESVALAAVRALVLERSPFPLGVLDDLSRRARYRLVRALSERPRSATARWLTRMLEAKVFEGRERLFAIAALPGGSVELEHGREVIEASGRPGFAVAVQTAATRMPSALVDRLVGAAHARLVAGAPVEDVLACLENATPLGEQQVLALSRVLPEETVEHICFWLASRESKGLARHVASALDGEVPLEPHLLLRSGPQIDSPERVKRVLGLLRDGSPAMQMQAFYALIDARVYREEMLDYASTSESGDFGAWSNRTQRLRALLRVPVQSFPGRVLLDLLADDEPKVRLAACRALTTSPYPEDVEEELLARAAAASDSIGAAAGRAIVNFGSPGAVEELWRRGTMNARLAVIGWLQERPGPSTRRLLRDAVDDLEGAQDEPGIQLRNELLCGLAVLGDQAAADALLRRVAQLPVPLLRRCGAFAPAALRHEHVVRLTRHLLGPLDPLPFVAREEVVDWLSARPDLEVEPVLLQLYRGAESEEVQLAALSGLLRGGGAAAFHAQLREAMQRPFSPEDRELGYEILANVPSPARALDLDTIAQLLLLAPLADPSTECSESLRGFPRSGDYPLHLPIIDVLRRQTEVGVAPFTAVAGLLAEHPARHALSGRRLGHALCEIARFPQVRRAVGPILARLILAAFDDPARFSGVAHLILAEDAEDREAWAEAAEHFAAAAPALLRDPLPPLLHRALLGDQSLVDGVLPESALSARPHICRARVAIAAGQHAEARAELVIALDLGEEDHETERQAEELKRRLDR